VSARKAVANTASENKYIKNRRRNRLRQRNFVI